MSCNASQVYLTFWDQAAGSSLTGLGWAPGAEYKEEAAFMIMPYFPCDLESHLQLLRREGRSVGEASATRILKGVLRAVQHLQAHRIAHCNITAANILLKYPDTPRQTPILSGFSRCGRN